MLLNFLLIGFRLYPASFSATKQQKKNFNQALLAYPLPRKVSQLPKTPLWVVEAYINMPIFLSGHKHQILGSSENYFPIADISPLRLDDKLLEDGNNSCRTVLR